MINYYGNGYGYSMQNALEAQKQYLQQQMSNIDAQLVGLQQQQPSNSVTTTSNVMIRIVNSMEEVNNLPCPSDGSSAYYPCPTEKKIYVKHIGNDGKIAITTYSQEIQVSKQDPNATQDRLDSLESRLQTLEAQLLNNSTNTKEEVTE